MAKTLFNNGIYKNWQEKYVTFLLQPLKYHFLHSTDGGLAQKEGAIG